jgi:hypothetical protein
MDFLLEGASVKTGLAASHAESQHKNLFKMIGISKKRLNCSLLKLSMGDS